VNTDHFWMVLKSVIHIQAKHFLLYVNDTPMTRDKKQANIHTHMVCTHIHFIFSLQTTYHESRLSRAFLLIFMDPHGPFSLLCGCWKGSH